MLDREAMMAVTEATSSREAMVMVRAAIPMSTRKARVTHTGRLEARRAFDLALGK